MGESTRLAERLSRMVAEKRGKVGIRATARQIGLSPATLSRVENGRLPDLDNFTRICRWLEVDPAHLLGFDPEARSLPVAAVHFGSQDALAGGTATALQELIVEARKTFVEDDTGDDTGDT